MRTAFAALALVPALLMAAPASAGITKLKGLHDDHERISPLIKAPVVELESKGRVFAVIGGDYGFTLYDGNGAELAHYDDSKAAVGLELSPGRYQAIPSVDGDLHHHQFIEVLIKTD